MALDSDLPCKLTPIADLEGHEDRAWHIAWNPARPMLASCSADKTVRLYSFKSQPNDPSLSFSLSAVIPTGHSKTVRAVAWSPSGNTLATASFDSNIGIWEQEPDEDDSGSIRAGEWECAALLEGHENECKSVAYSTSGSLLASCSRDKTVWVWEVQPDCDFECLGVLMEHTQDVKCVAWHPHEEILASASYDDTIKLYIDDPSDDWFCFATLSGHNSTVWSLAWSPCGRYLASSSDDLTIRIWGKEDGSPAGSDGWTCLLSTTGGDRSLYSISWGDLKDKNGTLKEGEARSLGWLACSGGDGIIRVWDVREPVKRSEDTSLTRGLPPTLHPIARLDCTHGVNDVNSISWCPLEGFEDLIGSAGDDGVVHVWKLEAGI